MAIYRAGTAAMSENGVITGTGTKWQSPLSLVRVGATIVYLTNPIKMATISAIVSDTEMRAIDTDGTAVARGNYIILLHDSITVDGLAQDVSETLRYYQSQETSIAEIIQMIDDTDFVGLINQMSKIKDDTQAIQTEAQANETNSKAWASNPEDTAVEGTLYSSLHYSRKSAGSATASDASAKASKESQDAAKTSQDAAKVSQDASKASQDAAKTSETNAKASENLINQAINGTIKSRGRPNEAGFTDINAMGNEADVGVWQLDNSDNYNLPNVPEASPGKLEVAMGGRFARTQIYTGMYGSMFVRSLNAAWNASSPDWMPWRNVGANYTRVDGLDVDTLFNAALLYGSGVVNAPTGTENQYCFIKVEAYGTSPVLQTITWGTANRVFKRSYAGGSWSAWVESINTGNMVSQIVTPYVAAYGPGSTTLASAASLDSLAVTGSYGFASSATSAPAAATGVVEHFQYDANSAMQSAMIQTGRMFFRFKVSGAWGEWKEIASLANDSVFTGAIRGKSIRANGGTFGVQNASGTGIFDFSVSADTAAGNLQLARAGNGSLDLGGMPVINNGVNSFASNANARQTLLNMGVAGAASYIRIPISTTQAFQIVSVSQIQTQNSNGDSTITFPVAFTTIGNVTSSNGDSSVGNLTINVLNSLRAGSFDVRVYNNGNAQSGAVRINYIATGLVNI